MLIPSAFYILIFLGNFSEQILSLLFGLKMKKTFCFHVLTFSHLVSCFIKHFVSIADAFQEPSVWSLDVFQMFLSAVWRAEFLNEETVCFLFGIWKQIRPLWRLSECWSDISQSDDLSFLSVDCFQTASAERTSENVWTHKLWQIS